MSREWGLRIRIPYAAGIAIRRSPIWFDGKRFQAGYSYLSWHIGAGRLHIGGLLKVGWCRSCNLDKRIERAVDGALAKKTA